jgi:hypothetical protein
MEMVGTGSYLALPEVVGGTAVGVLQQLHDGERGFRVHAGISESVGLKEEGLE